MNNQISYAPKAREDLLEIKSFIEEETGDIELAKKTISDIVTTNDSLSIFPEMGQRLLINLGSKIEYRYLLCHNYLSFYRYLDRTIYIDRILNSRRDYLRILLDEVHELLKALSLIDGAFYHMINILTINSILAFTNSRRVIQYRLYIHF